MKMAKLIALVLLALLPGLCFCDDNRATVTGKTVFAQMGIEDAELTFLVGERVETKVKSGYHGDWIARLPAGVYTVKARGLAGKDALLGEVKGLEVKKGVRVERVMVEMRKE